MSVEKSKKDIWEKLEVIGRLTSAILLAAITILLKYGIDDITVSLDKGHLVQNLIADLTTQDENVRQDIALIALNRSLGKQDERMVLEIAEQVFRSREITDDLTSDVAFSIIQEIDPDKAKELALAIIKENKANLRSAPVPLSASPKKISTDAKIVAKVFPKVVYIQYGKGSSVKQVKQLAQYLELQKINVPGIEQVEQEFPNNVRFFYPEDRKKAVDILRIINEFFNKYELKIPIKLQDLSGAKLRAPRGQVEIWLNL